MKQKIRVGEKFMDCDGEELKILRINEDSIVLRSNEQEIIVADIDDVMQDIASGELVRFK